MPECNGIDVLKDIKLKAPHVPVIMVTGVNEVETAINCLKSGAHDYLLKPIESERLLASLNNALRIGELESDYTRLAESMLADALGDPSAFAPICGQSEGILRLFRYVESVGSTRHPVLITGETGVGKELFAQARSRAPTVFGRDLSRMRQTVRFFSTKSAIYANNPKSNFFVLFRKRSIVN
jgi:DNA-binding NtrC family response regulator